MRFFQRREIWAEDPLRLVGRLLTKIYSEWVRLTYPFHFIGRNVEFHPSWDFRRYLAHRVQIGNNVEIHKDVQFGISCINREQPGEPILIIDDGCVIARHSQVSVRNFVHLGRNTVLSPSVLVIDHNHSYHDPCIAVGKQDLTKGGRIRIEQGCWIGRGAAIICDSGELVLGQNCVVAANALVSRSFPPYSVISGNPARVIKQFDPSKGKWVLGSVKVQDSDHELTPSRNVV